MTGAHERSNKRRSSHHAMPGRLLAEWVSLGISGLLILALAGFLLYHALRSNGPIVECEARVLVDQATESAGRFIVPLQVLNRGDQSIRLLRIEVTHSTPSGQRETRDVEVEYLGERSERLTYLFFDSDPSRMEITATPSYYLID